MKSKQSSSPNTAIPASRGKAKRNQNQNGNGPLIVGVGASDVGLQAFTALLRHLPRNPGMALVLVQHLAPRHSGALTELLGRATNMPVTEATDGTRIKPDHVYVIPPGRNMEMREATLHLLPRTRTRPHMPIDHFFCSLAKDQGAKSIGAIFSGTASDGTLGLKAIKAAGGITFVQEAKRANPGKMPRSAISAGCVDSVLSIEKIAKELLRLAHHPYPRLLRQEEGKGIPPMGESELRNVYRLLLTRCSSPGVVINEDFQVLHVQGRSQRYLEPAPGQTSLNRIKMVREGLAGDLRTAVQEARKHGHTVRKTEILMGRNSHTVKVNLDVVPVKGSRNFLVLFHDTPNIPPAKSPKGTKKGAGSSTSSKTINQEIAKLQDELARSKKALQSTIEEMESANEDLTTLNEELQNRNDELSSANNDLVHLLANVNIPILMLGNDLRIRWFTPGTQKLMNLVQGDVGRSINGIKLKFELPGFKHLISDAIENIAVKEREVQGQDCRWYSMRIQPYRTVGNEIEGAVISWVENTGMKEALDESTARYSFIFEKNLAGIFYARDGRIMDCNDAFARMLGHSSREEVLKAGNLGAHLSSEDQEKLYARLKQEKSLENEQIAIKQKDGTPGYLMISASLMENDGTAGIAIDVTRRTQAERQLSGLSRSLMQESDKRRRQLARDLHDQVGSQLGGLMAMLGSLEYLPGLNQQVQDGIAQCLQVAHDCANEVRTVSHLQHPMVIDEMGLGAAVRWYAEEFSKRSKIKVKIEIADSLRRMDEIVEIALYRIIQECLTNIQRHSGSETAQIRIEFKKGELIAEVQDFGKGFDLKNQDMGIAGMRERMRELGGRLEIASGKGGTTVRARLPLA